MQINLSGPPDFPNIIGERTGLGGLFRRIRIAPPADLGADYEEVLAEAQDQIAEMLSFHRGYGCKFYLTTCLSMSRLIHEGREPNYQHSHTSTLLRSTPILPAVQEQCRVLVEKIEKWVRNGSGFVCESVEYIDLCITRYLTLLQH